MPREIETKFKIDSPIAVRKKLKTIGATLVSKQLEMDTYYKSPAFGVNPEVIRLRTIGRRGIFTVKDIPQREKSRTYKVRDELETAIADAKTFDTMLKYLGFAPLFRKEKIRETYNWKKAKALIDKLPYIGFYVEIEATKNRIKKIAHLLGLDIKKGISGTYMDLFGRYKALRKKPKLEFIFNKHEIKSRG